MQLGGWYLLNEAWSIPNHEILLKECGLCHIETYIEKRRGTLRMYLEREKGDLLTLVGNTTAPAQGANKVLWWRQEWTLPDHAVDR